MPIDLTPQKELQVQKTLKSVQLSTLISIFALIITILVSGYFLYQKTQLEKTIVGLDGQLSEVRGQISNMSDIEITARNLDKKYYALSYVMDSKLFYSELLTEFLRRVPKEVKIKSLNMSSDSSKIQVTGVGTDYLSVSSFMQSLVPATEDQNKLFTDVTLNSINLESIKKEADFSLTVSFNKEVLKK